MNIKRAKEEVIHTVQAYLAKDELGQYKIPTSAQRPLMLIGPPGIGKTAIMEQAAAQLKLGFVAYTITHHTRQSAVGLPFIEKKEFAGKEYAVTEYTMSEIIASVYEKMEETGLKEGILFIDEINCISETLAATMLAFLQQKTFGNHKVPEGWVIVAAGNPPEYNKSVREYDLVTLDRIRKLEVNEDYDVWKEYAYQNSVHGAIITYLDMKRENFYIVETGIDGMQFVTARGWEDLSKALKVYEELKLPINEALVYQYLQHWAVAKDFANYLEFYKCYQENEDLVLLLQGHLSEQSMEKFAKAPFDERLTLIGLLLDQLYSSFRAMKETDEEVKALFAGLKEVKGDLFSEQESDDLEKTPYEVLDLTINRLTEKLGQAVKQQQVSKSMERNAKHALMVLASYRSEIHKLQITVREDAFEWIKNEFETVKQRRVSELEQVQNQLKNGFAVIEGCFGVSQELVIFVTELTMNPYSAEFIGTYGSKEYEAYSRELLDRKRSEQVKASIDEMIRENPGIMMI